jgi:hypothetical protein
MNSEERKSPYACRAFGCPLWGSVRMGADWFCGVHAMALPIHWQSITFRLNSDIERIRQAHHLMSIGGDWREMMADIYSRAEARNE